MQQIDKTQVNRVKQLINTYNEGKPKNEHLTQKKLAVIIDRTPESFNRSLKQNKLSKASAEAIAEFFHVRFQWVLGYDDFKTESECVISEINIARSRIDAVKVLAYIAGYDVVLFSDCKYNDTHTIEETVQAVKEGYKILDTANGNLLAYCAPERFNLICQDILELTEQRIRSYIREVTPDGEHKED